MSQRDRDRLVALNKAAKGLITQRAAAEEMELTERQVRRLLRKLKSHGDAVVIHGLRGRQSNRKLNDTLRAEAIHILSQEVYSGFGPTLASEYLASKHQLHVGRETLRQWMQAAGLWQGRHLRRQSVYLWRPRRSCRGDLVQWDTSDHDWLEGRGPRLYLIQMIDDATSQITARFVLSDSTEENMRLLWHYLERHGRPIAFYTDKASHFQTAQKRRRDAPGVDQDPVDMPPTQIGRALQELGIIWIAAHSPQAKGRVERSFSTAQDRLVKGLRVADAKTLEQANRYLQDEFIPWWNQHLSVRPANATDAHRMLDISHQLATSLSHVQTRQVTNDYTIRYGGKIFQIARADVRPGMRGSAVRVEQRLDGTIAVRFQDRYLPITLCDPSVKPAPAPVKPTAPKRTVTPSPAMRRSMDGIARSNGRKTWQAAAIDRTRTPDRFD